MSTQQFGGLAGKWCQRVSRSIYEHASRVICVSDRVREQLWQEAGESIRATVVYNGADPQLFAPKAEYWEPAPVILSIGNLIPIKGHETMLRALAVAADRHPRLACQIIGDGPLRGYLSRLAVDLGIGDRVRFLGRQSRAAVANALRECTLFVLPSHYEALGCVYLEAMASGKPVIGCAQQGIAEIVHHGVNGFLVEPHDVHGIASHIGQLLRDAALRVRVGLAARQTILEGLTIEHQAARLAEIYRECAV
jgi:glycosyltransferase involved in cell wall biosynthesis